MSTSSTIDESLLVAADRTSLYQRTRENLAAHGFGGIEVNTALNQITAEYRSMSACGRLVATLTPEGDGLTRIEAHATSRADGLAARLRSPSRKIMNEFKAGLG